MSIKGRIFGTVVGAAGLAAAAGAAGIVRQSRVIGRRGAGERVAFGELRSAPLVVVADDALDLHVEIDEPADFGGRARPPTTTSPSSSCTATRSTSTAGTSSARPTAARSAPSSTTSAPTAARRAPTRTTAPSTSSATTCGASSRTPSPGPVRARRPLDGRHDHHLAGRAPPRALRRQGRRRRPDLDHRRRPRPRPHPVPDAAARPRRPLHGPRGAHPRPRPPGGRPRPRVGPRGGRRGHRPLRLRRRRCRAHYVEFVYSMLNATPFAVVADFYPAFATLDKFEHLEALGRVPTAVICGTEDKITSVGHSRKLHSRIPGSSLLECEGAGHMVILERHKQVNAELDDLISLAQGQDAAVSVVVRRVGAEAAAEVLAVVQTAFGARPPLDPPADALAEDERLDRPAAGAARRPAGHARRRAGRRACVLDPTPDGLVLRRFGVVPDRAGHGRGDRAGRGRRRRRRRPRGRRRCVAREELPGDRRLLGAARLRGDRAGQPLRRARAVARHLLRLPGRRRDASAGGAGRPQPAWPATWSCSPASSGPARPPSPRASAAGLGVRGGVTSPTFVIARVHPSLVDGPDLVHVDAYRLGGIDELDDLDLDTSLDAAVTVVEWGAGRRRGAGRVAARGRDRARRGRRGARRRARSPPRVPLRSGRRTE